MALALTLGVVRAAAPATSPPDAATLRAGLTARSAQINAASRPLRLSDSQVQTLAAGRVARARVQHDGADGVLGAVWSALPRDDLWIAILDDKHDTLVQGLFEEQLPGTSSARKLLYQRVDLPWPFDDRQWVIDIRNNGSLCASSKGAVWERTWTLADPSIALSATPDALWVPVNDGGWTLVQVAGGTLIAYQARTVIGGVVPDEAVTRYAMSTLEEMLLHVVNRATNLGNHYGPGHEPLYRPDGTPVPPRS